MDQVSVHEKPFSHIIIDEFLTDDEFYELCNFLEDVPLERKEADLFSFEQTADLSQEPKLTFLREKLLSLKPLLQEKLDTAVQTIDMSCMFYYDTDYLLCHDDRLDTRKIAYIFYVAEPEDGGNLLLRENKKPYSVKKKIAPEPNRLMLFLVSEDSLHEVEEVKGGLPRISIGGWFH